MSDFYDNDELEKAFRENIEGRSMNLPPSVWSNIKVAALERQLIRYQSTTNWFKGVSGLLATALVGILLWVYQQKTPAQLSNKAIVFTKIDTLYLTQTQKIYVSQPAAQLRVIQQERLTYQKQIKNLTQALVAYQAQEVENTTNQKLTTNHNPKLQIFTNKQPITTQPTPKDNNQPMAAGESQTNDNVESFDSKNNTKNQNVPSVAQTLVLEPMESIAYPTTEPILTIPKVRYKAPEAAIKAPKAPVEPLKNRFSLAVYLQPEWNNADIRRSERQAFDYANQNIRDGHTLGFRAGLKLTPKWSVLAGVEFTKLGFDEFNRKLNFTAEDIDGTPTFLYRNALGTVVIPNQKLIDKPQIGNVLQVESNEPITARFARVSLGLRYNVLSKKLQINPLNPLRWTLYGLAGGAIYIPQRQDIRLDIFQPNRQGAHFKFTEVENQHLAFGMNVGLGLSADYGKRIGVFIEPTYNQTLTSLVRNMPINTYLQSFGLKTGINWRLGK
jgi:hypothetical protein